MKPTAFKIAAFLGVLLVAFAGVLMYINPQPQDNLPYGFFTPVIALEFIRTPLEVKNFFNVENNPAYEQSVLLGNWIDYGFMCLYSAFLLCIAIGIKQLEKTKAMYFSVLFCFAMLAGDALENWNIYLITINYKTGFIEEYLSWLNIFTWIKWSSIAATFLLFSPFFFAGNWFHKFIGLLCISCVGLCIAAFLNHGMLNEIFALNVVVVFLLLVIFSFTYKVRKAI